MTELKELPAFLAKVSTPWTAWIAMAAGATAEYLWPSDALKSMAAGVLVLFLADTLSGVLAAWVNKGLSSMGARRVFVKFCGYLIYIVVAATIPVFVPVEFFKTYELVPITAVMAGIAYTELLSIFENLKKMDVLLDSRFMAWIGPVLDRIKPPEKPADIHSQRRPEFDDPQALRKTDVVLVDTDEQS